MKAVIINKYGGTEEFVYTNVPVPEIKPDEVLIKVYATSVNPIDHKIRNGLISWLKWEFPIVLGWDVSGVIEKTGSKVSQFNPGDEVYAFPALSPNGTYAQYVAVKADQVSKKPVTINHVQAAAIPLSGLTAWQALFDHGKLKAGQKVFINGIAGGVGTLAVQLAKNEGIHVTGTTSAKNFAFLKDLGADELIDYTKENYEEKCSDIDVVIDCIGGAAQQKLVQILKPGGILVSIVSLNDTVDFETKGIQPVFFLASSLSNQLDKLTELIDNGQLKPVIAAEWPIEEIEKAHQQSETGHTRGKLILTVTH